MIIKNSLELIKQTKATNKIKGKQENNSCVKTYRQEK